MLRLVKTPASDRPPLGLTMAGPAPAQTRSARPGLTFAQRFSQEAPVNERPALRLAAHHGKSLG
ncbi:MAG: hypothetical protein AAF216_02020 [Pseudomonadota bacterium]